MAGRKWELIDTGADKRTATRRVASDQRIDNGESRRAERNATKPR